MNKIHYRENYGDILYDKANMITKASFLNHVLAQNRISVWFSSIKLRQEIMTEGYEQYNFKTSSEPL